MGGEELVAEAKRLIDTIAARPRFAGSAEESTARNFCADWLRKAGLDVTEEEFEFSEWPGRWGIPLIGGWLLSAILVIAGGSVIGRQEIALSLAIGLILLGLFGAARRRRAATLTMQRSRSRSVNLAATRGDPGVWLVAHLDSKSQTIPMLLRVASHVAMSCILVAAFAAGFLQLLGLVGYVGWQWLAVAGLAAALPSLLCRVGNRSPGALDNATGVAAVLLASRLIPPAKSFGVLLTSGEELDLAGARAWSAGRKPGDRPTMINCDTVDDVGAWRCMYVMRPHRAICAVEAAAKKSEVKLRIGKVIPGVITDSLAFNGADLTSVTIARGTLRTLARLHTAGDNSRSVSGAGAASAARLLARTIEELC